MVYKTGYPATFLIENLSSPGWMLQGLTIDLSPSFGDAVFNPKPGAIGRDAPDAFYQVKSGGSEIGLRQPASLTPDNRVLTLSFTAFPPKEKIAFLIDLDDKSLISARGPRRVTYGELAGATVSARMKGSKKYPAHVEATFNQTGLADSAAEGCT